jgi:hypothetical protein
MDPLTRLLFTLARWFRHPPSPRMARVMLAALLLSLAIVAVERWIGWPEWLQAERGTFTPRRL